MLTSAAMPANASMQVNTAMPMFLTSRETEIHMEIWLRMICMV